MARILEDFDFCSDYHLGKENVVTGALSRNSLLMSVLVM